MNSPYEMSKTQKERKEKIAVFSPQIVVDGNKDDDITERDPSNPPVLSQFLVSCFLFGGRKYRTSQALTPKDSSMKSEVIDPKTVRYVASPMLFLLVPFLCRCIAHIPLTEAVTVSTSRHQLNTEHSLVPGRGSLRHDSLREVESHHDRRNHALGSHLAHGHDSCQAHWSAWEQPADPMLISIEQGLSYGEKNSCMLLAYLQVPTSEDTLVQNERLCNETWFGKFYVGVSVAYRSVP